MNEYAGFIDGIIDETPDPLPSWDAGMSFNPWDSTEETIVGNPQADADDWHPQETDFTCAVVAQQTILNQFGIDVTESQLVYDATINGWLTDSGTNPADFANLLEYYGIGTHENMNASISDVMAELAQGRKVMVAVDSGEMWGTDGLFSDFTDRGMGADHAIVITGVDVSDPDNPLVYVNDSGAPDGAGKAYPMAQFVDAWEDSGCHYVATNDAPDNILSSPYGGNFNPGTGIYLTMDFWGAIAGCVYEGLETGAAAGAAAFVSTGSPEVAAIVGGAAAGIDTFVRTFELMDEIQRNDLFLAV